MTAPEFLPPRGPQDVVPGDACRAQFMVGFIVDKNQTRAAVTTLDEFKDSGFRTRWYDFSDLRVPAWRVRGEIHPEARAERERCLAIVEGTASRNFTGSNPASAALRLIRRQIASGEESHS